MTLAVCPGGVTTKMLTRMAGGDVAFRRKDRAGTPA